MKKFGSWSEQVDSQFRTSSDNKVVSLIVPSTLTGASNAFTTPNISGTADTILSRVSLDQAANRLQNKDLSTDNVLFADNSDVTKKLQLSISGFTTATTHVLTIPNLTDTAVTETHVQTLSNKTLTLPEINDTSSDHQYIFGVSELTADRTITLPLLTASDTFVFANHTQTLGNKTIDIDAGTNTILNLTNSAIKAAAGINVNKLEALTASRAMVTDGSGFSSASSVTATELGYVSGVTSAIQTQINSKQADVITTRGDVVYGDAGNAAARLAIGASGTVLTSDGTDVAWATPAGTGDVTAAAALVDHRIVRGDGGAKGIQDTGITIDDTDNITGIRTAQANNGFLTRKENTFTFTVTASYAMFNSNMTVASGTTVTVASNADLVVSETLTVTGTLTVSGNCRVF